jgi:hypothetical protein
VPAILHKNGGHRTVRTTIIPLRIRVDHDRSAVAGFDPRALLYPHSNPGVELGDNKVAVRWVRR